MKQREIASTTIQLVSHPSASPADEIVPRITQNLKIHAKYGHDSTFCDSIEYFTVVTIRERRDTQAVFRLPTSPFKGDQKTFVAKSHCGILGTRDVDSSCKIHRSRYD